jgi:osomolarity two-component system sensor histidine kinase TcsA
MAPPPAFVRQDGSFLTAPQISNETKTDARKPLDKLITNTPIPTVILNSSLRVIEVSESYLNLFKFDREKVLGSPLFDLYEISASCLPLLLGALSNAVSTQSVQRMVSPWGGIEHLQVTPIFDQSSLLYLTLELQNNIVYFCPPIRH